MLTFILKKEWFEKIERGEKTVEYREVKPYWTKRLWNANWRLFRGISKNFLFCIKEPSYCRFRLGYTNTYMNARIDKIVIMHGRSTDLKIDKPVYAIKFHLVEAKNENI